ncbi:MAG: GYD domain-containing protein [Acidimicrobiia bacterium]
MSTYVMLSTLGPEGMDTLAHRPERVKAVNEEVEAMGAQVVTQYALLGQFDFMTVLEAPDIQTVARVATALGSRGTLKTITLAAMPVDDFIEAIRQSQA